MATWRGFGHCSRLYTRGIGWDALPTCREPCTVVVQSFRWSVDINSLIVAFEFKSMTHSNPDEVCSME